MIKRFYCISNLKVENIHQFFSKIDNILDYLNKLDLINYKYIGNFFIGCEKWFISYGHFKDEMFTLFDFGKKFNKKQIDNYKYLQDYPISQEQVSNYRIPGSNHNYKKIDELLFKGSLFNCGIEVDLCYKLQNLILIKHDFFSETFHKFPKSARDHILNQIDYPVQLSNRNIFLTRSIGLHIKRVLDNLEDLELYFRNINYDVLNPENINYETFINYIRNADNIFLTWGGIMVSLIYVKPSARIYILKGKDYDNEDLSVIKNLILSYSLQDNITVINHINNIIKIEDIEKYIS